MDKTKTKCVLLNSILIEHSSPPNISKPFSTPGVGLIAGIGLVAHEECVWLCFSLTGNFHPLILVPRVFGQASCHSYCFRCRMVFS